VTFEEEYTVAVLGKIWGSFQKKILGNFLRKKI
jgi:hypothetical protein